MSVKPIPEGYTAVTPYLITEGAGSLLDFMKQAFGADERLRMDGRDGTINHAEVSIGGSVVMLGDAGEEWSAMPAFVYLYVDDCDATYERALAAGATSVREPADQFYGDRNATVRDPVGNMWGIATHVEDVSDAEIAKRVEEMAAQQA
jgi:PhnB protein